MIYKSLEDHYKESLLYFNKSHIVGLFLQGSQNYNLHTENSDVDTKLITIPTFRELAMNDKPVSCTHVRENNEHIDFKDVRLYMDTFRKQNLNFMEILFTDYKIINPQYEEQWNRLIAARERIARMNPYKAVLSMYGLAETKFKNFQHSSPAADPFLEKYGYVPKELHHLMRIAEFLERYIAGEDYITCMTPIRREYLKDVKRGCIPFEYAASLALENIEYVRDVKAIYTQTHEEKEDPEMRALLDDVKYEIMKIAMKEEMKNA